MNCTKRKSLLAISLVMLTGFSINTHTSTDKKIKDSLQWKVSGTFKPGETFFGKNITFLNKCNELDKVFYLKHSLDLKLDLEYKDLITTRFATRTKAVWGSPEIAPTTTESTKILNSVGQRHKHFISRHVMWIREAWLEFSLNEALGLSFNDHKQTLVLGAFPFQLGRGIALGDAFAVSPNYLGFYSEDAVDQYAFGIKIGGEVMDDTLSYDLYGAILNNKSNSLSKTGQKILGQQFGRLKKPERGFGKVNYLIAGHVIWTPVNDEINGLLSIEPYFLFNNDPEQKVEFLGDASSRLGTIGLAAEYKNDRFEYGFDAAVNLGRQKVKGWDRNVIELQNRNGCACEVNSHVLVNVDPCSDLGAAVSDLSPYKAPYITTGFVNGGTPSTAGSDAQNLVDNAIRNETNNGKSIGIATGLNLIASIPTIVGTVDNNEFFNTKDRFRNGYTNRYKGKMIVADAAIFCYDRDVRFAVSGGYTTGDVDPNIVNKDGDYTGFIGLQELYAGKRVKSAFFLGGAGKLKLPLDIPPSKEQPNRFGALASGFTNLAMVGAGVTWEPSDWEKFFSLNPNVIAFWQTHAENKFDLATKTVLPECARKFLGVELNVYIKKELMKNLKLFCVASVLLPGSHFDDVKGKPMNKAEQKILDRLDPTGFNDDPVPGLSNNAAYTFNIGVELAF